MKTLFRTSLFAASFAAAALTSQAQVLTAETLTSFDAADAYTGGYVLGDNRAATQTFTGVTSAANVTFRFIALDSATFATAAMEYAFSTWQTGGPNASALASFQGTFSIADSTSWTTAGIYQFLDVNLDLSANATGLTAATTYGLSIIGNSPESANFRIAAGDTDFTDGAGFTNDTVVFSADFTAGGAPFATDFAFAASSVGGGFSAVPEAGSAAVLFAGLFVGGLMFRRRRHLGSVQAQA